MAATARSRSPGRDILRTTTKGGVMGGRRLNLESGTEYIVDQRGTLRVIGYRVEGSTVRGLAGRVQQ